MKSREPSVRKRLAFTLCCLLFSLLATEGAVRFLLFHPSERARRWGRGLRSAMIFADPYLEGEHWRLKWLLTGGNEAPSPDPLLGWLPQGMESGSYRFVPELPQPPGKRPILLYGASYANCRTADRDCFQGLIGRSRLGATHKLYNYGVGGYGLDQMYLMLGETIDQYVEQEPIVVIGAVVDSDYERASFGFRVWRKPRLAPGEEGLVLAEVPHESSRQYIEEHGTGIRSYAWRGLLHSTQLLPLSWRDRLLGGPAKRREQRELVEAIVLAVRDELEARDVPYFFLLFQSPFFMRGNQSRPTVMTQGHPSPVEFVPEILDRHGIPYVDTLPYIAGAPLELDELYNPSGPSMNHPTVLGNLVLLEALCDGIDRFGR